MSDQKRIQRLPQLSPLLIALACGILGGLVDLATGPSVVESTTAVWVGSFGLSIGGVVAVLSCAVYFTWEAWYR